MSRLSGILLLAIGITAGAAGAYWYTGLLASTPVATSAPIGSPTDGRKIIYYRDPSGAPYWSVAPKKDSSGRDYLPVYDEEEPTFGPGGELKNVTVASTGAPKVLYYRNPMGLPDTSPIPKKDWMGMDYIPVYEGEDQETGNTVRVSLDKIQRSGVRTETVEQRVIVREIRAAGTFARDETRLTVVTMRSNGFIEDLFVDKTGQHVREGEPLFRVYSPEIQKAQIDLLVTMRAAQRPSPGGEPGQHLDGAMQRLRNLGVPENRIREVREKGTNPRTLDWPSPSTGDVIAKRIINGQRVGAGEELYRIADHSNLWIIADVAESDLSAIKVGTRANLTVRAYMAEPIEGRVTFIYPELRAETRTGRVRIEVPNRDGRLKIDMYADVVFQVGRDERAVVSVPTSSVIDSGNRQVVLVAKGEGRFEPRPVTLGRRGDDYIEVLEGLNPGETVVTSATFLIDAESNLKAALQSFERGGQPQ